MFAAARVTGLPVPTRVVLFEKSIVSHRRTTVLTDSRSSLGHTKFACPVQLKNPHIPPAPVASNPNAWPSTAKYCKFNVCLPFPGSSMVERSAVNRNVGSSNLPRGANLSSCLTNHLRKISVGPNCLRKVQMSEFCPSSHFTADSCSVFFASARAAGRLPSRA